MSIPTLATADSKSLAVTGTAAPFVLVLSAFKTYAYVCTVDSWVAQGATPTATAGTGSAFVPAKTIVYLDGHAGVGVSAIREGGSSGTASLTPVARDKVGAPT